MDISLSGNETIFDTEKNTDLLERIINWICRSSNDIVLDFSLVQEQLAMQC